MSSNFGYVDLDNLVFPSKMRVDYVRVYQPEGWQNSESLSCNADAQEPRLTRASGDAVGCDPPDYPTADYIAKNPEFYYNPNITVLADANRVMPANNWSSPCAS